MNQFHTIIRLFAIGFAICLILGIAGGAISLLGGVSRLVDGGGELGAGETFVASAEIRQLQIEVGAANLKIVPGDVLQVQTSDDRVKVSEVRGKLRIQEGSWVRVNEGCTITLTVPQQMQFEEVDITAGAGVITAESLSCRGFELELGAGKADFEELVVTGEADVEGGTGKITIHGGAIRNLDLNMGLGNCQIRSTLTGRSDVESGIGKLELTILGDRADYTLTAEKGIGQIQVDGVTMQEARIGSGEHRLNVEGGIGTIEIAFEP